MKKVLALALCAMLMLGSVSALAESSDKVHLEFFNIKPEVVDILNTLIDKFETENPDIDVEQTQVPDSTTVLQTRAATNKLPEMLTYYATDPRYQEMAKNGMLLDLTDKDVFSTIDEGMLKDTLYEGKSYILPISMNAAGVFYNKKIFEENGIEVPTTYEELIAVCEKLKAAGITPFVMHNMDWQASTVWSMVALNCVDDYETVNSAIYNGEATVTDYAGFEESAKEFLELNSYAQEDTMGTNYDQALDAFANGEAAMIIQGIWIVPSVKALNPDFEFSSFPLPAKTGNHMRIGYQNDLGLCISSTCANPEAALKFLQFMAREDNAQYYADMDGSASYIKGVVSAVEETKPILSCFDSADNIGLWPDQMWVTGTVDYVTSACQQLLIEKTFPPSLIRCRACLPLSNERKKAPEGLPSGVFLLRMIFGGGKNDEPRKTHETVGLFPFYGAGGFAVSDLFCVPRCQRHLLFADGLERHQPDLSVYRAAELSQRFSR